MTTYVLDLETTMECPVGNNKANPMWHTNKVVSLGLLNLNTDRYDGYYFETPSVRTDHTELLADATLVVGHNIKFDLLYIYRWKSKQLPNVWDTQLAAYLLSGQQHQYASLDELTSEYVGKHALKDDKIKEYWRIGVKTEDILENELMEYMEGDVRNTSIIFKQQFEEAEQLGILPLMLTQMDALRATIEMNRNGMEIDTDYINKQIGEYSTLIVAAENKIKTIAPDLDFRSNKELSLYFFGGEKKMKVREDVGFYKNGKTKTKLVDKVVTVDGLYSSIGEVGKSGYYSVDDSVLQQLAAKGSEVAHELVKLREYYKIKETYYEGLRDLEFSCSGRIYPNLNHCATKTGRLSSTNPNLQNQTDTGDVKRAYISRHDEGSILELDYSQLEMVALAYISNDRQLIDDINNGRDMHRELYNEMYGRYPTDKERKPFKRFSFLLVYGGGVTTLMAQSGCDKATAQRFINTFYSRYKGVKRYHEQIVKDAEAKQVVYYTEKTSGPQYKYYHQSPTGRCYIFTKYYDEKRKKHTFSPTELKNWPIQGFATGDVVPMMVGLLLRNLEAEGLTNKAKLVMTVHDSVVLDVDDSVLEKTAQVAKTTLESAPQYLKTFFDIDFPCRLSVGVEAGTTWQDKKELLV